VKATEDTDKDQEGTMLHSQSTKKKEGRRKAKTNDKKTAPHHNITTSSMLELLVSIIDSFFI